MNLSNNITNVEIVSFSKFLKMIQKRETKEDMVLFETIGGPGFYEEGVTIPTYIRRAIKVVNTDDAEISTLLPQLQIKYKFKYDLQQMAEDAIIDSVMEYGEPTVLVRISPRFYLVANPKDYCLIFNKNGKALYTTNQDTALAYEIKRETEEQVLSKTLLQFPHFDIEVCRKDLRK